VGFGADKWLSFSCLASVLLEPRVQLCFFLIKGLCYPSVKDGKRVSKEKAKCEAVSDMGIEF